MRPGHMACPGCGEATVLRLVLKVLGEKTIMVILPSCVGVISATYPNSTFRGAVLSFGLRDRRSHGIRHRECPQAPGKGGHHRLDLRRRRRDLRHRPPVPFGAADRNDNFIYVCLDNEGYMNTGIQSSSSTPQNAWTMTTPGGRRGRRRSSCRSSPPTGSPTRRPPPWVIPSTSWRRYERPRRSKARSSSTP